MFTNLIYIYTSEQKDELFYILDYVDLCADNGGYNDNYENSVFNFYYVDGVRYGIINIYDLFGNNYYDYTIVRL